MSKNASFLTPQGRLYFEQIRSNCEAKKIWDPIFEFELLVLANSIDLYFRAAQICNAKGVSQKPKKGGWDQVRPEYTVMKTEYNNILKHAPKFALNPMVVIDHFGGIKKDKKKGFKLD